MNTDGLPLGKYATQLVGGGVGVYSGATLCTGTAGLGCALGGGSLTIFGAGNITEATTGIYTHFSGSDSTINPVKKAFEIVPGSYGPVVYSGMDLATAVGVGFVKVPLLMGTADGLNRPKTMFDVMVPKMDNNYFFSKSYISTPYRTAGTIYLLGVGGKGYELGDKIHEGPKNEN